MKTFDTWPCQECIVQAMCTWSCDRNTRYYEQLLYEFSLNPRRTIERYTFLKGKTMDWILQRSLFRMVSSINSYTFLRLNSNGGDKGPFVTTAKKFNDSLRTLYERRDDPL